MRVGTTGRWGGTHGGSGARRQDEAGGGTLRAIQAAARAKTERRERSRALVPKRSPVYGTACQNHPAVYDLTSEIVHGRHILAGSPVHSDPVLAHSSDTVGHARNRVPVHVKPRRRSTPSIGSCPAPPLPHVDADGQAGTLHARPHAHAHGGA